MLAAGITIIAGIIIALVLILSVGATQSPVVNDPVSPIDADKTTLSGTAEPGAKIVVMGGPSELSPAYADETGYWEKTVSLTQETTNVFSVTAEGTDDTQSSAVTVTIVEGVEAAAEYEEQTGADRTAPDAPEVDEISSPVDADSVILTGTAEPNSTIIVSGADGEETSVNSSGTFSIEVDLDQDAINKFNVNAMDASGNISSTTKIEIEEISAKASEESEEENYNNSANEEDAREEISFSDTEGHWAEEYIEALAATKVVGGYENGNFGPNDYITRAAITKIALNAFEYEIVLGDSDFTDLENDAWYEDYVNSAREYGIIGGYDDGTFRPNGHVNRAEALKILLIASGIANMEGSSVFIGNAATWENNFSDVSASDWFYEYVMQSETGGIVSGYSDGTFGPQNYITRAEVCKIVSKMLDLKREILSTPTI